MSEDTLTDFPEIDSADMVDQGFEPPADPATDDAPQEPDADADPDEPAAEPEPAADPNANLPEYRRESIANRENRELRAQLDRLERLITEKNAPPAALVPEGDDLTPEQKNVQAKFFKLFPQAKTLFEKADAILRAAEVAPNLASREEEADMARANSALQTVENSVAARVLGAGKTGANLRPEARQRIASAFARWCGSDYASTPSQMPKEMQARAVRYQNGDATLHDEFAKDYVSDFTPVNRPERVAAARTAGVKSPRGGPSSAPPPAGQKPPDPDDPDAIHTAAFRSLRADAAAR